jgi:hypothetical protein
METTRLVLVSPERRRCQPRRPLPLIRGKQLPRPVFRAQSRCGSGGSRMPAAHRTQVSALGLLAGPAAGRLAVIVADVSSRWPHPTLITA